MYMCTEYMCIYSTLAYVKRKERKRGNPDKQYTQSHERTHMYM